MNLGEEGGGPDGDDELEVCWIGEMRAVGGFKSGEFGVVCSWRVASVMSRFPGPEA